MHGSLTNGGVRKGSAQKGGRAKTPGTRAKGRTKADKLVEEGGTPSVVVNIERSKRNLQMYAKWRRGMGYDELAERYELKPRAVQTICDQLRAASVETLEHGDPLAGLRHADRVLTEAQESLSQAAVLYERALDGNNLPVAVAAHRRVTECRKELLELMQLRGIVPRNIADLQNVWEGVELLARILAVFDRHDIPDEVGIEIARTANLETRSDRGRLELDLRMGDGA
jgi:hypothetical protein